MTIEPIIMPTPNAPTVVMGHNTVLTLGTHWSHLTFANGETVGIASADLQAIIRVLESGRDQLVGESVEKAKRSIA